MDERLSNLNSKLLFFQKGVTRIFPPATEDDIIEAEKTLNWKLSNEMKEFFSFSSGMVIIEYHIFGVQLGGIKRIPRDTEIVNANINLRNYEWWPREWLKLGSDGFGNYIVAIAPSQDRTEVANCFWIDHELIGTTSIRPVNLGGFLDFIDYAINDMIKYYDPKGKLRNKSRPRLI